MLVQGEHGADSTAASAMCVHEVHGTLWVGRTHSLGLWHIWKPQECGGQYSPPARAPGTAPLARTWSMGSPKLLT